MNLKKDATASLIEKLNIKLGAEERELEGKPLMKVCSHPSPFAFWAPLFFSFFPPPLSLSFFFFFF